MADFHEKKRRVADMVTLYVQEFRAFPYLPLDWERWTPAHGEAASYVFMVEHGVRVYPEQLLERCEWYPLWASRKQAEDKVGGEREKVFRVVIPCDKHVAPEDWDLSLYAPDEEEIATEVVISNGETVEGEAESVANAEEEMPRSGNPETMVFPGVDDLVKAMDKVTLEQAVLLASRTPDLNQPKEYETGEIDVVPELVPLEEEDLPKRPAAPGKAKKPKKARGVEKSARPAKRPKWKRWIYTKHDEEMKRAFVDDVFTHGDHFPYNVLEVQLMVTRKRLTKPLHGVGVVRDSKGEQWDQYDLVKKGSTVRLAPRYGSVASYPLYAIGHSNPGENFHAILLRKKTSAENPISNEVFKVQDVVHYSDFYYDSWNYEVVKEFAQKLFLVFFGSEEDELPTALDIRPVNRDEFQTKPVEVPPAPERPGSPVYPDRSPSFDQTLYADNGFDRLLAKATIG